MAELKVPSADPLAIYQLPEQWRGRGNIELERAADELDAALPAVRALEQEKNQWFETAREMSNNVEFYRNLLLEIGARFGVAAYTSDDGSVQQDVLALKVPELVRALEQRCEKADAERNQLRAALVALVGVDGREELEQMEVVMRLMPAPAADKAATIDAIHALIGTCKVEASHD